MVEVIVGSVDLLLLCLPVSWCWVEFVSDHEIAPVSC